MSELEFIYKRKSIRDYKDAVIPKEDILKMLDAATHAPSPKHQQNWHFVVVQDKEIIKHRKFLWDNRNEFDEFEVFDELEDIPLDEELPLSLVAFLGLSVVILSAG